MAYILKDGGDGGGGGDDNDLCKESTYFYIQRNSTGNCVFPNSSADSHSYTPLWTNLYVQIFSELNFIILFCIDQMSIQRNRQLQSV
jgi:hypothetical protein